jgi:hypothetical protein
MKKNLALVITATVISLIIWVFFEVKGMPLTARDTAFVVAVCLLFVAGIRGILALLRKKRTSSSGQACLVIGVVLASGWLLTTRAQSTSQGPAGGQGSIDYACTPGKPVAKIGDTISLTVWALPERDNNREYTWSVDAGNIEGTGRVVRWRLAGVQPGLHLAKVRFAAAGSVLQQCAVQLVVVAGDIDLRGGHRASGRAWLVPDQEEDTRYGLRSYILFGAPPSTDEQRERYLRVIEEYLAFPSSELLAKYYTSENLPLDALNITYFPLKSGPSQEKMENLKSGASNRPAAEELLRRYDYERALVILGGIEGEHHQGPYIISYPARANPLNQPYILQDLSWVPPDVIVLWMREFLNLAAQERDWSKPKTASFVLKMRTIISVGGQGYDIVQKSVEHLVSYYQGGSS